MKLTFFMAGASAPQFISEFAPPMNYFDAHKTWANVVHGVITRIKMLCLPAERNTTLM